MQFSSIFVGLSPKDTWIRFEVGRGWVALSYGQKKVQKQNQLVLVGRREFKNGKFKKKIIFV
jgi:hypothetical protein